MKSIDVTEYGILPASDECNSSTLQRLINRLPDGCEVRFPAGSYYLSKAVDVRKKQGLTISGDGAVIVTHFAPAGEPSENNDAF